MQSLGFDTKNPTIFQMIAELDTTDAQKRGGTNSHEWITRPIEEGFGNCRDLAKKIRDQCSRGDFGRNRTSLLCAAPKRRNRENSPRTRPEQNRLASFARRFSH